MKLQKLRTNVHELIVSPTFTVLFSYNTPVGYMKDGKKSVTNQHYSKTTSMHINKWLDGSPKNLVTQEDINTIVKGE